MIWAASRKVNIATVYLNSLPERQTRVHAKCKSQQKKLRNVMNHNTQQLISPQDPEWRKIYDNCRSRQGHFTQKVPERQTRITLGAKQKVARRH